MLFPCLDTPGSPDGRHAGRTARSRFAVACVAVVVTILGSARVSTAQSPDVLDDFNGPALNTSIWTYTNPLNDAPLTMTGSQVSISVPGTRNHFTWSNTNTAPGSCRPPRTRTLKSRSSSIRP